MHVKRIGSSIPAKLSFNIYDWEMLATLLEQQVGFIDCIELISNNSQKRILSLINEDMRHGKEITEIFTHYFQGSIAKRIPFYQTFLTLPQAIRLSCDMDHLYKKTSKRLIKAVAYPFLLITLSYVMLQAFSFLILPYVCALLELENKLNHQIRLLQISCYVITSFLCIVVIYGACFLVLYKKRRLSQAFQLLKFSKMHTLIQKYVSYVLAQYLICLNDMGLSTKQAIHVLTKDVHDPWIYQIALDIDGRFLQGMHYQEAFQNDFFDPVFLRLIRLGLHTNQCQASLKQYQHLSKAWARKSITKLRIVIQCIAYSMVAFLVAYMYQMMLYPLELLEQI